MRNMPVDELQKLYSSAKMIALRRLRCTIVMIPHEDDEVISATEK